MKGKSVTTSVLPKKKKGGKVRFSDKVTYIPDRERKCLTKDQTKHIYEIVEMNWPVNIHAMKQDIRNESNDRVKSEIGENDSDLNPYQLSILNKRPKEDAREEQMINWSIFNDKIKYVNSHVSMNPSLTIRPLEDRKHKRLYSSLEMNEDLTPDMIFDEDRIRDIYLDKYDGVQAEISQVTSFDKSTDLSTTYLGKTDMTRDYVIKAEEKFPISGYGYTSGKLMDKTECTIWIDTGASKSYVSKSYYMRCKSLHTLAKLSSTTQRIQVGNGQYVAVLFVIPVIIDIYVHRFEVFTLVSEIHDNVDLVLGMKNVFELEGVIDTRDSSFKFLNRSLPFYSKDQVEVKPKERKFIKIEAPFVDEISGLAIVKMLDSKEQCMVVLKSKFVRNCASLDVTNNTQETVIFELKQMLGTLDLRSLGYYKIKQGVLQQNLCKCYHFESVERLCEGFNTIINERKKEEKEIEKIDTHG